MGRMAEFLRSFRICAKRWRLLCLLAVALLIATSASAQSRPDAKKLAADELAASEQAAAAHDHRAAFEHALGAWQLDESNPAYLWAAAVQASLAGMDDKAEPLFKQWQALPARDKSLDLKAREQLADIVKRRAAAKAAQAEAASRAGDHGVARRLFLEAAALDPGDAEHLYGAGVEAMAVKDEVAGVRLLEDYLRRKPGNLGHRAHAERVVGKRGAAEVAVAEGNQHRQPGHRNLGIGLVAGGGAVLLTGLAFLVAWRSAEGDYAAAVSANRDGAVSDPLRASADSRFGWGMGLAGFGLAVGGAGAWLWATSPDQASIGFSVTPGRVQVVGRF